MLCERHWRTLGKWNEDGGVDIAQPHYSAATLLQQCLRTNLSGEPENGNRLIYCLRVHRSDMQAINRELQVGLPCEKVNAWDMDVISRYLKCRSAAPFRTSQAPQGVHLHSSPLRISLDCS
jgi:hypothetical protein